MKSDKKTIAMLNDLLAGELTAVDQYLIHGEMYADMGLGQLAEKALHESEHERLHARALIQRTVVRGKGGRLQVIERKLPVSAAPAPAARGKATEKAPAKAQTKAAPKAPPSPPKKHR